MIYIEGAYTNSAGHCSIKRTILILILGHLACAPRVQKEAGALRAQGHQVLVRGAWWDEGLAQEDLQLAEALDVDFAPVVDVRRKTAGTMWLKVKQRLARELFTRLGVATGRVFGPGAPEFLKESRRLKPDLVMVHSESGLWVGKKLLDDGWKVGVDFEDWFSQDLLPQDRKGRPVRQLQRLERELLRRACCTLTTTEALAKALAEDAGCRQLPVAIPNCFPAREREAAKGVPPDEVTPGRVSFYWFSQTIGPGRGLETLAKALTMLEGEWELNLRGAIRGYGDWSASTFPPTIANRVKILPPVPNRQLLGRSMGHHVGLALEEPFCSSRDLTATNKIFEYLRAGLAVIATATRGQQEVMAKCPKAGIVISPGEVAPLAEALQRMLDEPDYLATCRKAAWEAGASVWAWEQHQPRLVEAIRAGCL